MKLCKKQLHKKNTGFTMMEILVVVGIILALLAVSVPGIIRLRKTLRQRELDSKAEVLYMAAQSRMTQLRTGGFGELYGKMPEDAVTKTSDLEPGTVVNGVQYVRKDIVPADAVNDQGQAENLCYVVSDEGEAAYQILPQENVDKDLWSGSWIVEFDPETGVVYAVFYSESSLLVDTSVEAATADLDSQRVKSQRLSKGAKVGYYGGDLTLTSWNVSDNVKPEIILVNEEKLTAKLYCSAPKKPLLRVTVTDTAGNSCVMDIPQNKIHQTRVGVYQADLELDSLESKDTSFYAVTKGQLLCGTTINVKLTAGLTREDLESGEAKLSVEAKTNSLFAYREGDAAASTAYIAYGRHLQNLDNSTSHVLDALGGKTSGITEAVQLGNISFLDDSPYAAAYGSRLFTPIHNDQLTAYRGNLISMDGRVEGTPTILGLRIKSTENNVGLFSTFAGTIQDILVTGPKILGGSVVSGKEVGTANVGTLIGSVSGLRKTVIRNVQVFLSNAQGDLNMARVNSVSQVTPWLRGRNVGGLIGSASSNELEIIGSSASMPIKAERYAGGLVGTINCKTTIQDSYADGYLRGTYVGGLIGGAGSRSTIVLSNFYSAGYGLAEEKAAGLVVFDESYVRTLSTANNGYSAMDLAIEEGKTGTIYPTAPSCVTAVGVGYAWQENWESLGKTTLYDCRNADVERLSYEILSGNQAFSYKDDDGQTHYRLKAPFEHVTDTISVTKAYNLMDQGLTGYPLPKLRVTNNGGSRLLTHYGDWKASFEEGALVYYEIDEKGNYRFEGGNVSVDQIGADSSQLDYTRRPKIVGDGYALAYYTTATVTDWSVTVSMDGSTQTLKDKDKITVSGYRLYPIDKSLLNDDTASAKSFYRKLTVTEKDGAPREYYLNPNFASCFGGSTQANPDVVRIRSPRQLYALSRLYGSYFGLKVITPDTIFRQELDLDYSVYKWADYYQANSPVISSQNPIGMEQSPFAAAYDGQSNTIQGLGISTQENQVGLFGMVEINGRISNLVLIGQSRYPIIRQWGDQTGASVVSNAQTVNIGALVGYNKGTVQNCAATGYEFSATVYNGATLNLGGLVGKNEGSIYTSSAETPHIYLRDTSANVYAGGFVGDNGGTVSACYAAGYLEMAEAQKLDSGKNIARIAGFAARNDNGGNLIRCYAGAPLMGSGDTQMYGFACTGGSVLHCYYLDGGTYEYRGNIYSLNASGNASSASAKGIPVTAAELRDSIILSGFVKGNVNTYLGNENRGYSYPASLTRNGSPMHFGPWPNQDKDMGEFGVFYWEYEKDGNTGYHLSFQGTSGGRATVKGETLCEAHDDGGVITQYGYGYFYKPSANLLSGQEDPLKPKLTVANCVLGEEYTAASAALEEQMPQYKFVAFKTGLDGLRMTGSTQNQDRESNRNAFWTLTDQVSGSAYTYCVSPFFGDAFNLVTSEEGPVDGKLYNDAGELCNDIGDAGTEARPYQVRSVDQLQFINWNFENGNTTLYLNGGNKDSGLHKKYPYLSYGKYEEGDGSPSARLDLYWVQTHDLNAQNWGTAYTPIGSMYDDAADSAEAHATMAFFSGSYDGQAYVIKNVSIETSAQCIGIFGVTAGAKMKNIILYSDKSSKIIHNDSKSWYSMGGIAGMAGRMGQVAEFTNCTVSGYTIIDRQRTKPGWGGGCVGGLVGTSTMNLTNCTAASTIQLEIGYKDLYQNLRVGGLVGCARSEISGCYAGGTITSKNPGGNSKIWIGGILGGIVLRNEGNLEKLIGSYDGPTKLSNCYSFVDMPARGDNISASYAIGSNGEMLETCYPVGYDYIVIKNCYAYTSTSTRADDYAVLKNGKNTYQNINLNRNHQVSLDDTSYFDVSNSKQQHRRVYWRDRRVELQNDRNPFLSYKEMREQLLEYLNAGITSGEKFDTVTVRENGVSINGKYSFPGDDAQLVGLDYPFPTILTQEAFGETVNVHYGPWPKFGLYWEEHKVNIDLVENRNKTGTNLLALYGSEESEEDIPETEETESTVPETTAPEATVPETTVPETTVPESIVSETLPPEDAALEAAEETLEQEERESSDRQTETETPDQAATVQNAVTLSADSLQAIMSYKLYLIQVGNENITNPQLELQDTDGNPIADNLAAAKILSYDENIQWDGSDYLGYFNVVFQAQHPGVVRVKASLTKDPYSTNPAYPPTVYEDYMTITVTADLKIIIQEESLPLTAYESDNFQEVELTLEDTKGTRFTPGENAGLTWALSIDSQESEADLVTWTSNAFIRTATDEQTGAKRYYLTTLKGFSPGEGSLKLALTYTWDTTAEDPEDPIESSLVIPVVVHPSDVLGIGDGAASRELSLPHTPPSDGTFTDEPRADETNIPRAEGLFLYASNESFSYTDLASFQVKKAELKLNGTYRTMTLVEPSAAEGNPTDPSRPPEENTGSTDYTYQSNGQTVTVRVSDDLTEPGGRNTRYTYRAITVEGDGDDQWSLRLTLWPKDAVEGEKHRTYVLEYNRPNTVRFCWQGETENTLLKEYRVEQGEDLSKLDQDELDEWLADLAVTDQDLPQGYHWTWLIPQGTITANQTVTQTQAAIRYYVAYNAGYEDYEWDDNVPMENATFVYAQEGKTLSLCTYNRPGYRFAGWDTDESADTVVFRDGESFTDEAIFAGREYIHNRTLTLYAVWEPKEYIVSYNGGYSGWDGEGKPRMEPSVYSIAQPDGTLAENKFVRDGYTFLGWAYESGAQEAALAADATLEEAMRRGGEYVVYQDVTLYAVWKQEPAPGTDDPAEEGSTEETEDAPQEENAFLEDPEEELPEPDPTGEAAKLPEETEAAVAPEQSDTPPDPKETEK